MRRTANALWAYLAKVKLRHATIPKRVNNLPLGRVADEHPPTQYTMQLGVDGLTKEKMSLQACQRLKVGDHQSRQSNSCTSSRFKKGYQQY